MRTIIHYHRVSYPGLVVGLLFLLVWLLTGYLTGYSIEYRFYVYSVLLPFVLPLLNRWTKDSNRLMRWWSIAMGFFFAACCTLGYSLAKTHHYRLCLDSIPLLATACLKMVVYSYVFYKVILCAFSNVVWHLDNKKSEGEKMFGISDKKLFAFFVICRIPYLVAFYPCLFDYDAAVSLGCFGEGRILNDHHPFMVACVQKLFFDLGKALGDPSIGFALMSILFIMLVSTLLVYVIRLCGRMGAGLRLQIWLVLLFALFPFFSLLNIYDTKDGIFAYSSLFFVVTLADILLRHKIGEEPSRRLFLMHGVAVVLMCFSRHQGVYFVLIQYLLLFLFYRRLIKRISLAYLPGIAVYFIVVNVLYPLIGVSPAGRQEMLGVFIQQSARCMISHPDKVTDEQKQAFTALVNVDLDNISSLKSLYNDTLTDPVKFRYRFQPVIMWSEKRGFSRRKEMKALSDYLIKSWLPTFIKCPGTCALASLNLVNAFFYNTEGKITGIYRIENWKKDCPFIHPDYDFYCRYPLRTLHNKAIEHMCKTPLLEFIFSKNYYTWLYIFFFVVFIYRRDKTGLVIFSAMFLTMALFFICPVATYRYSFPLIMNATFLMIYSTHEYGKDRQKNCGTDTVLQ